MVTNQFPDHINDGGTDGVSVKPQAVAAVIAGQLAMGMISYVGGLIANKVISQVFYPSVPTYFDQVYEEIAKVVGAELQKAAVTQISGTINNIVTSVVMEYEAARRNADLNRLETRQYLYALLQKYESAYLTGPAGMLGTLMAESYQKPGFPIFLLGACLHLALYQEMANVDPNNRGSDGLFRGPLESSYGCPMTGTVATTAIKYADFAERVWPQILNDRATKIHLVEAQVIITLFQQPMAIAFWDELNPGNQQVSVPGTFGPARLLSYPLLWGPFPASGINEWTLYVPPDEWQMAQRNAIECHYHEYAALKAEELTDSMGDPVAIIAAWRQLVTTPLRVLADR